MNRPYKEISDSFKKSGVVYECTIAPTNISSKSSYFHVVLRRNYQELGSFKISPADNGHWMPDNRKLVDPWLADAIGTVITNNF